MNEVAEEPMYYKVKLMLGGKNDPLFLFHETEKEKMLGFVDICLENGQHVSIVLEALGADA